MNAEKEKQELTDALLNINKVAETLKKSSCNIALYVELISKLTSAKELINTRLKVLPREIANANQGDLFAQYRHHGYHGSLKDQAINDFFK